MVWSVQGITSIVHPKQTWMSVSGMMTSSDFLVPLVAVLAQETAGLKRSMAAGANFKKTKQESLNTLVVERICYRLLPMLLLVVLEMKRPRLRFRNK